MKKKLFLSDKYNIHNVKKVVEIAACFLQDVADQSLTFLEDVIILWHYVLLAFLAMENVTANVENYHFL